MHTSTQLMNMRRRLVGGAVAGKTTARRRITGISALVLAAAFAITARADIPYASSSFESGPQMRERKEREKALEARIEELSARLEKARMAGENVMVLEQELATAKTELDAVTYLPKELMPFHEHMVARMDQNEAIGVSRCAPEPISPEVARQFRVLFREDMGHPCINANWQTYLVGMAAEAAAHPDLSREAARELRDALLEYYHGIRVYYGDADIVLSMTHMAMLAEGLYRAADPRDAEARQTADHLTERVLAWSESLEREDVKNLYGRILGNLQEAAEFMEEAAPEWLETELQSARDPATTGKLKRIEEAVLKTKETARRDARNVERIKEVIAYGQADHGRPEWNASMLRMQLMFIRTVLSKSRTEVSEEVVKYLCKTLRDMALSGRISGRELWTLWAEAVRALYQRAEVLWEVRMNRELAETDFIKPEVNRITIKELLRSYLAILGKSPRQVPRETVAFIDRHLLELVMEEPQRKLVSKEHWGLWARAAGALGPNRASDDMKRFVGEMKKKEKDATPRSAYQRVWRRIGSFAEKQTNLRSPTTTPTTAP